MTNPPELLIGAHTSAAGGAYCALLEGKRIGATSIQLFTANQKRWESKPLDENSIEQWKATLAETNLKQIMSHDSYLINLGASHAENFQKSLKAFKEEIMRCNKLDITYLNFHPGAALEDDPQVCMDRIASSIISMEDVLAQGKTRLLLETTAGQGTAIGYRFEQLAYILDKVEKIVPIGVCIDTCHIFVAGYDIRTAEAWEATLKEFDRVIGLKHLYAFHLNDSVKDIGSRVDRHAALGEGKIGMECFRFLMQDPRTRLLPKYLETPGGPDLWEKEIRVLREVS